MSHARTVVITDASAPAIRATAARLAAAGDLVLMGDPRAQICEDFAARLRSGGSAVFAAHLDLADAVSVDRFIASAEYLVGVPDVLISTAGLADGCWAGAQHLVTQLVSSMIDNRRGHVVLLSPELVGTAPPGAARMLEAWVCGLDAEFVGTGVRASLIRSSGAVPPDDAGCLIATAISSPEQMHLRVVDVIPVIPAPTLAPGQKA